MCSAGKMGVDSTFDFLHGGSYRFTGRSLLASLRYTGWAGHLVMRLCPSSRRDCRDAAPV